MWEHIVGKCNLTFVGNIRLVLMYKLKANM